MISLLSGIFPNKHSKTLTPSLPTTQDRVPTSPAPPDRFYKIVVAPGSHPSTEFIDTIEKSMSAVEQGYSGPVLELLKQKPVEFRIAKKFPELFNKLKTRESLLGNRGLPPFIQNSLKELREEDPANLMEELQNKPSPLHKLALKTALNGQDDTKLQNAFAKGWRANQLKSPGVAAIYLNDRIYLAEQGRQEKLALVKKAEKALAGLERPEQLRATLIGTEKHELAHHIDEVAPAEPWKELSSDPAFRECVMQDVRKLAEQKLIPYQIDTDGSLFFEYPQAAIFPENILRAQASEIIPESQDTPLPFGEVFSEVLSAMHGDHSKMIESLIYCTTGDKNKIGNADAETFVNQLFPNSSHYVETVLLPKIAERSRQ